VDGLFDGLDAGAEVAGVAGGVSGEGPGDGTCGDFLKDDDVPLGLGDDGGSGGVVFAEAGGGDGLDVDVRAGTGRAEASFNGELGEDAGDAGPGTGLGGVFCAGACLAVVLIDDEAGALRGGGRTAGAVLADGLVTAVGQAVADEEYVLESSGCGGGGWYGAWVGGRSSAAGEEGQEAQGGCEGKRAHGVVLEGEKCPGRSIALPGPGLLHKG